MRGQKTSHLIIHITQNELFFNSFRTKLDKWLILLGEVPNLCTFLYLARLEPACLRVRSVLSLHLALGVIKHLLRDWRATK